MTVGILPNHLAPNGAGQYPFGVYPAFTILGWATETSDTTARQYLGAAYDSSANLTYAIDGANYNSSVRTALVTAFIN